MTPALEGLTPATAWDWSEAHTRDPAAVAPLARLLATHPEELAAWMGRIQRATGGRRRELTPEEVARYRLGLCIRCETPRPSAGRYCGEGCRRERNRPDLGSDLAEEDRRRRALLVTARGAARRALLSWLTRTQGAWVGPSAEALELLAGLRADLELLAVHGKRLGADIGPREARAELAKALAECENG